MTDSSYLSWQDLAHEDTPETSPDPSTATAGAAAELTLPQEFESLLAERELLEKRMAALTGHREADPEDERRKRAFPVRVHTKESRIEERRLRLHDERLRMLANRKLAEAALRRRRAIAEAEAQEVERQRRAQELRIAAEIRRRQEKLRADRVREAEAAARLQEQWAEQRRRAVVQTAVAARREMIDTERRADAQRELQAELLAIRSQEQRAAGKLLEAHLRQRSEKAESLLLSKRQQETEWETRRQALKEEALERRLHQRADERRREKQRAAADHRK